MQGNFRGITCCRMHIQRLLQNQKSLSRSRFGSTHLSPADVPGHSIQYHLNNNLGQPQEVCKTLFLITFGHHQKNNRLIVCVIGTTTPWSLTSSWDCRGRDTRTNQLKIVPTYEHIESFNWNTRKEPKGNERKAGSLWVRCRIRTAWWPLYPQY